MRKKSKTSYASIFKTSFAAGAGTFLGLVSQMFVGIVLFLVGIVTKNQADAEGAQDLRYYGGLVLMVLGCAMGLGLGAGALISEVTE